MLIPRFSLRWLFLMTGACALFSMALAAGWRGEAWAIAVAGAVVFLIFTLVVHAAVFWLAWLVSRILRGDAANRHLVPPASRDPAPAMYHVPRAGDAADTAPRDSE